MNKKVIAIICTMIITAMIFASCSARGANENTTAPPTEQASDTLTPVDAQIGAEEKPTEAAATETAADETAGNKEQSEAQKPTEATTKKTEATTKKTVTTTKKAVNTTKKPTTTKKPVTTTKKAATTKKPVTTTKKAVTTTKKPTTTKKHVTAKQVQNEVNAYIKSKGLLFRKDYWTEFGISEMTPDNASWTLQTAAEQEDLDSGYTLRECKEEVDLLVSGFAGADPSDIYCYYDSAEEYCYILYW